MLTELRTDVAAKLVAAGVKAVEYTTGALTPPVAAIVPGQPYLSWGEAANTFAEPVRLRLDVLLISHRTGDPKADAKYADTLIEQAVAALDDYRLTRVTRPGQLTIDGVKYLGAVVSIAVDTREPTPPAPPE